MVLGQFVCVEKNTRVLISHYTEKLNVIKLNNNRRSLDKENMLLLLREFLC